MNSHSKLYKVYSIVFVAVTVFSLATSAVNFGKIQGEYSKSFVSLIFNNVSEVEKMFSIMNIIFAAFCVLTLLMAYVEFSKFFTFSNIVDSSSKFEKPAFALNPKFYSGYSTVIIAVYFVTILLSLLMSIYLFIVSPQQFNLIPLAVLISSVVTAFPVYITFYCRYKIFSDIYEYKLSNETEKNLDKKLSVNVKSLLKGYGVFSLVYYIIAAAILIASLVVFVVTISKIEAVTGVSYDFTLLKLNFIASALYLGFSGVVLMMFFNDMNKVIEENSTVE